MNETIRFWLTHTISIAHFECNLMKVIKFKFVMAYTEWCASNTQMGICIYLIRLIVNVITHTHTGVSNGFKCIKHKLFNCWHACNTTNCTFSTHFIGLSDTQTVQAMQLYFKWTFHIQLSHIETGRITNGHKFNKKRNCHYMDRTATNSCMRWDFVKL